MNAEVKTKWIEALRSNEYEQGVGQLQYDGYYCCLGVLCDIVDPEGWGVRFEGDFGNPPASICDKVELPQWATGALVQMNDTAKKSFPEIADYIEEKL